MSKIEREAAGSAGADPEPHAWENHDDSCECHITICADCGCTNEARAQGGPSPESRPLLSARCKCGHMAADHECGSCPCGWYHGAQGGPPENEAHLLSLLDRIVNWVSSEDKRAATLQARNLLVLKKTEYARLAPADPVDRAGSASV